MPLYSLGLGALVFAAFAIGGNVADGATALGLFALVAAVFSFGSPRSETLGGLGGSGRDERWAAIDLRATAFGGLVVILAPIGAWLYELADGRDGDPYGRLLAVGGIAYIAAIAFLRRRADGRRLRGHGAARQPHHPRSPRPGARPRLLRGARLDHRAPQPDDDVVFFQAGGWCSRSGTAASWPRTAAWRTPAAGAA